ncbi:MAG: hypothetical protein KatS3mg003_1058 [Candidatus Nitrosocaldaceae archaeon]|nr:MAG: hypothetical protein KatS3mg003_1058 [Candidatus Nitrosocaldaceae archaeon]
MEKIIKIKDREFKLKTINKVVIFNALNFSQEQIIDEPEKFLNVLCKVIHKCLIEPRLSIEEIKSLDEWTLLQLYSEISRMHLEDSDTFLKV